MGWGAAALIMVAIAFIVGRPGGEQGLLSATPSATPTPPLPIVFGTGLDPATNQATGATDRFRNGDPFAYSVTLQAAPAVEEILVEVVRLDGQERTVVQEPSVQRILPEPRTFAFQVLAADLLAAWGAGEFEMRIWLRSGATPLATGRFTLLASPEESAG
ncbi:MAG TPA: hypothetical protein VHK28_08735 [Candidatus Limnocylindria bacterium]|nr:hypothetical protein [Candidatus Limnocylindria bacterium]